MSFVFLDEYMYKKKEDPGLATIQYFASEGQNNKHMHYVVVISHFTLAIVKVDKWWAVLAQSRVKHGKSFKEAILI